MSEQEDYLHYPMMIEWDPKTRFTWCGSRNCLAV